MKERLIFLAERNKMDPFTMNNISIQSPSKESSQKPTVKQFIILYLLKLSYLTSLFETEH